MAFVIALFAAYLTMTITQFGGTSFTVLPKKEVDFQAEVTTADIENKLVETTTAMFESQLNVTDGNSEVNINHGCIFLGFLIQVFF